MPNKLSQFWQELKRRRVIHVIVVYASAAFVILEAVDIIFPRLNFPDWTVTFVMILLAVGFPIALIFSWIFDVTPEGLEKTKPLEENQKGEHSTVSSSWRIATYVCAVILLGLIAFNIFGGKRGSRIDESLARSIAVLPFHNYSGDPGQDFMCQGLTDEIISHLFKVRSFDEVRSLTSVLPYKDSEKSIKEIARELQVNYILEGSYKRMGDELKITAQLIEPGSDNHIWLRDYELPYSEVPGIPGEIALQIADHLKAFISGEENERIGNLPTDNIEAYQLCLEGGYRIIEHGYNDPQALDLAMEAISMDPDYADAYALAGLIILGKGKYAGESEIQSAALDALPYFEAALELDQNNSGAYWGKAEVNLFVRWDYIKAEQDFLKTIELAPNSIYLIGEYIQFLTQMRQPETALVYIEKVKQYEYYIHRIRINILTGKIKEAYEAINLIPDGEIPYPWIGELYLWVEEYDSVRHYLELAIDTNDPEMSVPWWQCDLAIASYRTGELSKAREIIEHLIRRSDTTATGSPAYFTGRYYSHLGELDSAFFWLDKAFENKSPEFPWFKVDPAFNNLKDDPRYWDLYERTGHKAYDDYLASKNQ